MVEEFGRLAGPSPEALALKHELSQIILWNEREAPRSRQVAVGPSELGGVCDRKLAYRIAGTPPINIDRDPWPAIVGTSIHDWLERAVNRYQSAVGDLGYLTETRVYPDQLVRGRCDLFNTKTSTVIDYKSVGVDGMRKIRKGIINPAYRVQIQVYGLGHERAGREVKHCALIFLSRSGWLDDAEVYMEPYDRQVALDALARLYRIADQLIDYDVENNPQRFGLVDATPGDECIWCGHYNRDLDPDIAASEKGCPGR
jgi:hypothetical protein